MHDRANLSLPLPFWLKVRIFCPDTELHPSPLGHRGHNVAHEKLLWRIVLKMLCSVTLAVILSRRGGTAIAEQLRAEVPSVGTLATTSRLGSLGDALATTYASGCHGWHSGYNIALGVTR